jgi:Undecaprenyl-phosphate glucose phosphotransferase
LNKSGPIIKEMHRFTSNVIPPLCVSLDLACLILSVPISLLAHSLIVGGPIDAEVHLAAAVIAAVAFFLIRQSHAAYAQPLSQMRNADKAVALDFVVAALLSIAIVWQFGLVDLFSRGLMLAYVVSCASTLFVSRFLLRAALYALSASGRIGQRVAIYGANPEIVAQAYRLLGLQGLPQLQLIGVVDDRGERNPRLPHLPFIGGFAELVELARAGGVDQVLIALPEINRSRLDEILEELSAVSLDISMIPREALALAPAYKVSFLGEIPLLTFWQRPFRDINRIVKRAEDIVVAASAAILLMPLLLLTAIAIKLSSDGPVLFVQPRFGFNNKEIFVLKFRSMYVGRQDVTGEQRTRKGDDRITPVGKLIRKLSIDELPQLWNVLRGEMSVVGPRPHAVHMKVGDLYYFDAVKGYASRHRVKPGITGLAQVRGLRGEIDTIERAKQRVELDKYYIDNWSLGLDLQIIVETAFKIVADKDAY